MDTEIKLEDIVAKVRAEFEAEQKAKAEAEAIAALKAENEALKAMVAEASRLPANKAPAVLTFQREFDNMDVGDHALLIDILTQAKKPTSEGLIKSYHGKIFAEEGKSKEAHEAVYAAKMAGMKSNELDYSTYSSYGDEWVGVAYSTALWESIRLGTPIVAKLPTREVPRGTESMVLPLEYTDPTFYKVAEATDHDSTMLFPVATVTSSKVATAQATLSLSKLGGRVPWSGELEERSLVPWVSQLRAQLQVSAAEYLESAVIDGDNATAATTNVNDIGSATTAVGTEYYLVWDGFRVSPLVTTAANSRSAAGSLDVLDYLNTLKLMGGAGINALDSSKVSFIIDPNTNWASMALPEVMTKDVFSRPTLEGSKLASIFGYEVIVSGQMHKMSSSRLANSAGKVDQDTATNNKYGAILAVRWDQWTLGWQRRATIEVTRYPRSDSWEITMLMVAGLAQRDTEAAAISYNVGV